MVKNRINLIIFFIFGLFLAFPAFTQTTDTVEWTREDLQSIYMEHLRQEGYLPLVDVDGDIQFKVSGDNFFIIVDENDLQFFQIYTGFSLGIVSRDDALDAANSANRLSKTAKVSISSDDSLRIIVSITAELLLDDPMDFIPVFTRALSLIRNAENNFIRQLPSDV